MKKQYLAKAKLDYQAKEDEWTNAMLVIHNKRFASTYDEAKNAIDEIIARGHKHGYHPLKVVDWKILVREVTEWEEV